MWERSRLEISHRVPFSSRSMVRSVSSSTSISPRSVKVLSYKYSMGISKNSLVLVWGVPLVPLVRSAYSQMPAATKTDSSK